MKLDSLGRRNRGWTKPGPGAPKKYGLTATANVDLETYTILRKRAKLQRISMSQLIREYIEWGLENDQIQNRA